VTHEGPASYPCPPLVRLTRSPPKWSARQELPKRPHPFLAPRTTTSQELERLAITSVGVTTEAVSPRVRAGTGMFLDPTATRFARFVVSDSAHLRPTPPHPLHDLSRFADDLAEFVSSITPFKNTTSRHHALHAPPLQTEIC